MSRADLPAASQQELEQFVVFTLDNEEYAVPVSSVAEVVPRLEITPFPDAPEYIVGLANLRGKILPVLDLEKRFQLSTMGKTHQHILVAENEQHTQFGMLVDKVKDVIKIPRSSIQRPPEILKSKIGAEYLPGVIVLNGKNKETEKARIVLILDMPKILSAENVRHLHTLAQTAPQPTTEQLATKEIL